MHGPAAMPTADRMFRVIVAGGIALSATAPGLVAGCGGAVSTTTSDGGHGADAFPVEGRAPHPEASSQETGQQVDAFPQEGPPPLEAGLDARIVDSGGDEDVFPHEGPNMEAGFFDTGHPEASTSGDAGAAPDGFPHETATP